MKRPNGYGSVVYLGDRRRNPYGVRVTTGFDDDSIQKYKYIGYYAKQKEAMQALDKYNSNPYPLNRGKITFKEIYEAWSTEKFKNISESAAGTYKAAYSLSAVLHSRAFESLRTEDFKKILEEEIAKGMSKSHISKIKNLYSQLYTYANDMCDMNIKNYAILAETSKQETKESKHQPFAPEEIKILWAYTGTNEYGDVPLILIHSGMRIGELLTIKQANVFIDEKYMIGGIKTEAGKNRTIPIHDHILPFIKKRMESKNEYLIPSPTGVKFDPDNYRDRYWQPLMEELKLTHYTHDGRHTCATLLDEAGANQTAVKKILGHKGDGVTETVYTHKSLEELLKAINLINTKD